MKAIKQEIFILTSQPQQGLGGLGKQDQPHGGSLRPGPGFKGLHTDPKIPSSPTAAAESKVKSPRVPPKVAWFSLRGPSRLFPAVLKPDIAAPGVDIAAAMFSEYTFTSGTSMATAYISGLVAIIKCQHPDWPPSAIKSAMTTTDGCGLRIMVEGTLSKIANAFDFGGGIVNPSRVLRSRTHLLY